MNFLFLMLSILLVSNTNAEVADEILNTLEYETTANSSSTTMCNYTGNQNLLKCGLVKKFDWEAYNKTLAHLRQLFILRLRDPKLQRLDTGETRSFKKVKFLNKLQKEFDESTTKNTIRNTKYDKNGLSSRILKTIHIIQGFLKRSYLNFFFF